MSNAASSGGPPSFRTEAHQFVVEEMAKLIGPEVPRRMLELVTAKHKFLNSKTRRGTKRRADGFQEWRGHYLKLLEACEQKAPAPTNKIPPTTPSAPQPARPLTLSERVIRAEPSVPVVAQLEPELDLSDLDLSNEEIAQSRENGLLTRSIAELGEKLGKLLETLADRNKKAYFESGPGDPLERVDRPPFVIDPKSVVATGKGGIFDKMILIILSTTVTLPGDIIVKRDYRLNGRGATKEHDQIVQLDNNLKIRSARTTIPSGKNRGTYQFYAKAFFVNEGDELMGYLYRKRGTEEGRDLPEEYKHYVVRNGKVVPV